MDADQRLALADRDPKGKFLKGHKKSSPGRPKGAINVITRSLREQVLDGLGDIPKLVTNLAAEYPPAAAGLLARLMPPAETADDVGGGGTVTVVITPIKSGTWLPPLEIERRPDPRPPDLRLIISDDDEPNPAA
jgi:hypothetical protein